MKDRILSPKENNVIDTVRKVAQVYHNFQKNKKVISFNSELANKIFKNIEKKNLKVSFTLNFTTDNVPNKSENILSWLSDSCCGYYFMVDSNVFFEKEEDQAAFILRFSNSED